MPKRLLNKYMNLFQFYQTYDTDEKCKKYIRDIRWPNGNITCVYCGHSKCYTLKTKRYKCGNNKCNKVFSDTSGTIFHSYRIPLSHFIYLIYITAINKKNSSTYQEGINLGITQKTVWYVMMRIRMLCYQNEDLILSGEVEADETYVTSGRWRRIKTKGRKLPILGIIERGGGRAVIKVIANKNMKTVQNALLKHVSTGSTLFTDSAGCYFNCSSYFKHFVINHRDGDYVKGNVHTNSVENMWKNFKNIIKRTHTGVSLHHLQRYCDEFAYKWNTKNWTPMDRFKDLMNRAINQVPIGHKGTKLGGSVNSKGVRIKNHKEIVEMQSQNANTYQSIKQKNA